MVDFHWFVSRAVFVAFAGIPVATDRHGLTDSIPTNRNRITYGSGPMGRAGITEAAANHRFSSLPRR